MRMKCEIRSSVCINLIKPERTKHVVGLPVALKDLQLNTEPLLTHIMLPPLSVP